MSPKDMSTVYKNVTTLTFDGFIRDLYTTFGMTQQGIQLMWQVAPSKSQDNKGTSDSQKFHLGHGVHREQLHPGDQLEDITQKYLHYIQRSFAWQEIPNALTSTTAEKGRAVSLYSWCASVLGNAAIRSLYGDVLLEIEPRLLEYFYSFDEESWKLTFQLPPLLAKRMHAAREESRKAYVRYFEMSPEKRPGACHYIRTVEAKQRQAGMTDRDIAIAAQMFFWGSVLLMAS